MILIIIILVLVMIAITLNAYKRRYKVVEEGNRDVFVFKIDN
jgi:hypothetical protein